MKRRDIDYLILYQHKARELENICLIRAELERRGYSVEFYNVWNLNIKRHPQYNAKVIIGPNISGDDCLYDFVYGLSPSTKKILDMQLEQILTEKDNENINNIHNIKGVAREIVHISWGKKNYERLLRNGVNDNKIALTGPIHMDFLREEFRSYYYTKDEIKSKYGIDERHRINLVISSFAYENIIRSMSAERLSTMRSNFLQFVDLSIKTQIQLLFWIEKILAERDDMVFIYRPHPSEEVSLRVRELENKYTNFKIIPDMSVKQWVLVSDYSCLWFSTSIAEVFFSNKNCSILRPYPLEGNSDLTICKGARFIETFEEFKQELYDSPKSFPLDELLIRDHYDVKTMKTSYNRICDLLEEMITSNKYDIPINLKNYYNSSNSQLKLMRKIRKSFLFEPLKLALIIIAKNNFIERFLPNKIRNKIETVRLSIIGIEKDQATKEEINNILTKIKAILN